VDRLHRSSAEGAEHIRAMMLCDGVSDADSTDAGAEYDGNYVEPRECDSVSAE
jgi:hypothetical protein